MSHIATYICSSLNYHCAILARSLNLLRASSVCARISPPWGLAVGWSYISSSPSPFSTCLARCFSMCGLWVSPLITSREPIWSHFPRRNLHLSGPLSHSVLLWLLWWCLYWLYGYDHPHWVYELREGMTFKLYLIFWSHPPICHYLHVVPLCHNQVVHINHRSA